MKIYDIFDRALFEAMVDGGYVKVQTHPYDTGLVIANYTQSATWDNVWNEVTMNCRGLIFRKFDGEIVARPFPKFFNYGQDQAAQFVGSDVLVPLDKADGSLGILHKMMGRHYIATRGSFNSDQAIEGTRIYNEKYHGTWIPRAGVTYLFEIVYPDNRIVLDYGDMRDLILLGIVNNITGKSEDITNDFSWPGPRVEQWPADTLANILTYPPRENAEGYVLWKPSTDERVKIKQEDYLVLHRLMTNTSEKHIWEVLSSGLDPMTVFAEAPDEFHDWVKFVVKDLRAQFREIAAEAYSDFSWVYNMGIDSRKVFAEKAKQSKHSAILFKMFDDQDYDYIIWKMIKPAGGNTMRRVDEDAN